MMFLTYKGENYSGWQKQPNALSIQEVVEEKLDILLKDEIRLTASGRTDAKVNAYMQPVSFECLNILDKQKFLKNLNGLLPDDIRALSIVESELNARFSAKKKTYLYKMYLSNIDLPLVGDALRVDPNIDIKLMKKFITLLKGSHDFDGFRASGGVNESTTRTIYNVKLVREGLYLNFYITGNGFLYKMVRNIVGTMIKIGEHKLNLNQVKNELFTNFKATATAKPEYLYLLNVEYNKV